VSRPRRDAPDRAPIPAADGDLDWLVDLGAGYYAHRGRFEDAQLVRHEAARLAALDDVADRALALARSAAAMPGVGDLGPDGLSWARRCLRNHRLLRSRTGRPRIRAV
jgi:hypothetical protein